MAVTPAVSTRLEPVPLSFSIGTSALPPGEYDCQVTVLDGTGAKSTFWRGRMKIDGP